MRHRKQREMNSHSVRSRKEVEDFLRQFMPKLEIFGIMFLDREKNEEALKMLGITPRMRKEIIRDIEADDYIENIMDEFSYGDMWVFGKDFDGNEIYVKISLGAPGTRTICISFHIAEHPLDYAFR